MGNVILHKNVDSVTHLANLEDFWVISFFFFLGFWGGAKIGGCIWKYPIQVFVLNTKVYIPTWYLVFLLFKHTVEHAYH